MALGWVGFRWRSGTSTGSRTPDAEDYRDWRFGFSTESEIQVARRALRGGSQLVSRCSRFFDLIAIALRRDHQRAAWQA
jgi:hypothetical protein